MPYRESQAMGVKSSLCFVWKISVLVRSSRMGRGWRSVAMAKRATADLSAADFFCPRRNFKRPRKFKALQRLENAGMKQTGWQELSVLSSLWDTSGSGGTPCQYSRSRGVSQHYQESRGVIQQAAEAAGEAPLHEGLLLRTEVPGGGCGAASGQRWLLRGKGWKSKGKRKLSKLCCTALAQGSELLK